MKFEWDENKNRINRAKHGISFSEVTEIFENPVLTWTDNRQEYGEDRKISVGAIEEVIVIVVVHTNRSGKIRIISARLANTRERGNYHAYIKKTL